MAKKTYTIIATRDDYVKINISANSKEEALKNAINDNHESEWKSYDIGNYKSYEILKE